MSHKKITIHDIAKELNTTASTVSRALKDHPSISQATKDSVKKMAAKLDYQQNKIASSLRSGRSHIIGVIIPSAEISFFGSVVHGIERIARSKGYHVLLFQSNESTEFEKEGIETLLQSRVDGIIASIAKETTNFDHYREIKRRNVPLILFDRANDDLGVPAVVVNDYKGAFLATEHLIKEGYKRVAHISGQQHIKIFNDRLRGYVDALRANNIEVNDDLILYGKVSIDSGKECARTLLASGTPPEAIFAVEDFTALGAMQAIKEAGKTPGEIGVIGFANEAFSAYISPSLSTVDQQTAKMGETAANLFISLMNSKKPITQPEKVVLEPMLLIRESSQKKKKMFNQHRTRKGDKPEINMESQFNLSEHPHSRYNILTGDWILVSPHRTKRPWQGKVEQIQADDRPEYDPKCYLCPGNLRADGSSNPDYKESFVFINDFSSLLADTPEGEINKNNLLKAKSQKGICRVISFSPRHDLTLPEIEVEGIKKVVDLWAEEFTNLSKIEYIKYIQIFENKGEIMGCSNPHPHGQIWAQNSLPVEIFKETARKKVHYEQHGKSLLSDYLALELQEKTRLVFENEHFAVLVPFWAVWPYETIIISKRHVTDITRFTDEERMALADALKRLSTRYDNIFETSFPYSAGMHQAPVNGDPHPEWHWHMHFYPPLLRSATVKKFMVGYEMLANPQRDITAEFAAERLRSMSEIHYKTKK